ncbi:MAG: helix-turn-helix transcriptional regulator [Magnetococcales bacterium]|nr:helix-turn-helix transcriptional regulator [Magnetococcales bacterium]
MVKFPYRNKQERSVAIRSPEDLGLLIREVRKEAKMTQNDVAALLNLGRRFVGEVERGKSSVELGRVLKLLNGMGLDLQVVSRG